MRRKEKKRKRNNRNRKLAAKLTLFEYTTDHGIRTQAARGRPWDNMTRCLTFSLSRNATPSQVIIAVYCVDFRSFPPAWGRES